MNHDEPAATSYPSPHNPEEPQIPTTSPVFDMTVFRQLVDIQRQLIIMHRRQAGVSTIAWGVAIGLFLHMLLWLLVMVFIYFITAGSLAALWGAFGKAMDQATTPAPPRPAATAPPPTPPQETNQPATTSTP